MPVQAFKNAFVSVDGVDFSSLIRQVTLAYSAEALDKTGVGDETRSRIGGIKDWTLDMEFYQNFDSGSVDGKLFSLVGSSTFVVILRPATSAATVNNPQYQGTGYLESVTPIAGAVGEIMMTPTRILAASDLSRITT